MKAQFGKVAVLLGGNSAEREVSLKSGAAVHKALCAAGIDAHLFDPAEQALEQLHEQGFERVFIALHGRGGEDGTIQGALEFLNLPYTGSDVLGSALAMDKIRCKYLFEAYGLRTSPFVVVDKNSAYDCQEIMAKLGHVMVKPAHEGSSIGMAQAQSSEQLREALENAFEFDDYVLVEKWLSGREYTVSILADEALPVIEMRTPTGFYDYQAKYQSSSTEYYCPADISEAQTHELQTMASAAFKLVGAKGWGRVDAMQGDDGEFYLLEVNTVPGMTEKSLVPMAAKARGISFEALVVNILEQTL